VYVLKIAVPPGGGGTVKLIFLSENFFPYFFHVHLNILDKVVSSLYAIFGTALYIRLRRFPIEILDMYIRYILNKYDGQFL
jgi:hypothetical protein